jgi:DNA repair photolyase
MPRPRPRRTSAGCRGTATRRSSGRSTRPRRCTRGSNDSPEQLDEIVTAALDAGAESIDALPLHLRGATKPVFLEWLRATRPELVPRYDALYGNGSEMRRDEQRRLMDLVKPRGRTWETRVRERFEQRQATSAPPPQLPLF